MQEEEVWALYGEEGEAEQTYFKPQTEKSIKMDGEFEQTYSFTHLPSKKFSFLEDKNTLTLLMKW